MLYPISASPFSYSTNASDIISKMDFAWTMATTQNQIYMAQADFDSRVYTGDPSASISGFGNSWGGSPRTFCYNFTMPIVNMISGHQINHRKSPIAIPIENGDQKTADQYTKIFMWQDRMSNFQEIFSESCLQACITGMNLIQIWVDYRDDPVSGNIKYTNKPYNSFIIDPFMRRKDMEDCNYLWTRTYMTQEEGISLLPDKSDFIASLPLGSTSSFDGRFNWMPEANQFTPSNLMAYDEFYYRAYRRQKQIVDKNTGEIMEWKYDDDRLKFYLSQVKSQGYDGLKVIEADIPTVRLAIVIQNQVVYDGPNPLGIDSYPFALTLGYFNPQIQSMQSKVQGVVRAMRDSQILFNRRMNIALDAYESQPRGMLFHENALIDPADVYKSGNGKGIGVKDGTPLAEAAQKIPFQDVSPAEVDLNNQLKTFLYSLAGVTEENMGMASDDIPGVLAMLRQGAGLTNLQPLFSGWDFTFKQIWQKTLQVIQNNFTPGKVKRILAEDPSPQFYQEAFGIYDVAIEEGFHTATQKQMALAQALEFQKLGIPIAPEDLIEMAQFQKKDEILANMKQREQSQAQAQQMRHEVEIQQLQAQIDLYKSQAEANRGMAIERVSRVKENESLAVERKAEARKDDQQAILNMAKALKEIQSIDIQNLEKLVLLARQTDMINEASNS